MTKYEVVEPVKADVWNCQAGDVLNGILLKKESNVGRNKSWLYTIEKFNGEPVKIWGSATLDPRMEKIEIGTDIEITFKGTERNPKSGNSYKVYIVGKAKE